jgi:predicted ribosome quality control (RQC) complex YloA/Tae2 family protein
MLAIILPRMLKTKEYIRYKNDQGLATQSSQPSFHLFLHNLSTSNCSFVGKNSIFQYIVDNAMLNNYFTLRCLSLDLNSRLRRRRVTEAFSQTKDTAVITFQDVPESLIVSCRSDLNALFLHPRYSRAKANTANVLTSCRDKVILSVSIDPGDRIVTMTFDDNLTLRAHFFGTMANVFLVDKENLVVDAFRNGKKFAGTAYETRSVTPPAGFSALRNVFKLSPSSSLDEVLKKAFPHLGSIIVNEILFRSHLSPTLTATQLDEHDVQRLDRVLEALAVELSDPRPRIYWRATTPHTKRNGNGHRAVEPSNQFSIITLEHLDGYDEQVFENIHDAIRAFISRRRSAIDLTSRKAVLLASLGQHLQRTQRAVHALQRDFSNHDRSNQSEQLGTLLMAHLNDIHKGLRVAMIDDGGTEVEVPLDPSLTPLENAQRYFSKAKRSRQAREGAGKRLEQLKSKTLIAESLHSALSAVTSMEELKQFMNDHEAELDQFGIGKRSVAGALPLFRTFTVDGGFEVLAGKSSRNNDLLTLKHTKPNDLWFHARGSSGSHVVLKVGSGRGEPSKKAKEQAASIAAYYSKMRNAKLVPVAMTERKYVRKPRGSPPGTVVLEREKVIFAAPALPDR